MRAKKKGLPTPSWGDEKDFLRDPEANPVVAWPMHLFDCCPISDGASCALLVGEEIAKNFTDSPLYVIGLGQGSGRGLHAKDDLTTFEATRYAAQEAYEMAGLGPQDVQFAEVHDCFSIAELIHMEDLGFCEPGESKDFLRDGKTDLNGELPVNTDGGLKADGHPIGATGVAQIFELVTQLRGEAGKRQVEKAETGLAHNIGGIGGTAVIHILRRCG